MIAGINEILNDNGALTTALGGDGKIFPMVVDTGVQPPFVATYLAKSGSMEVKDAVSGIEYPTVGVNVHAKDYDELETVCDALREALNGITSTTETGHTFIRIWLVNEFDRPDMYDVNRPTYTRTLHFNCIIKR